MDNKHIHTESELFARIAQSDEQAFAVLFHRYKQKVYNVAWTYTRDENLAEDIVQDAFVRLWNMRHKLPEIVDVGRYLYVIGRNRAIRVLQNLESIRKAADAISNDQASYAMDAAPGLSEAAMEALVQKGLEHLSPQQRQVFELLRIRGQSRDQVAEIMQISKATVGVHLTIATKKMRAFLINKLEFPIVLWLLKIFF